MNRTTTIAAVVAAASTLAHAAPVRLVVEQSGQSWYTEDGRYVALIGFASTPVGTTVTAESILDQVVSGAITELYNGTAPNVLYATGDNLTANGIDPFTALTFVGNHPDDTRAYGAFYAFYEGTTVLANPNGGTVTLGTGAQLGVFSIPVVPAPGAAGLALLGSILVFRRRR
ncbi:MAG: hypothetical protein LAT64_13165 [Phycisphaerales bacterium]|nr:hypothetical protein [Planctomycetota bacterium]MCH8509704.1 hypothetical protein [Phycisphaerales bacterium]